MATGGNEAGGISASNGGMILIVEDDDRISRLERFILEQVGYRVTWAGSGEEALEILPTATPSLVLLDVMLPQMDGFATCQKIRESSQVPIIMVTAKDRDVDKVKGLEMGADDYITKPFSTHELTSRVKSVLKRTHSSRGVVSPDIPPLSHHDMSFLHPRDGELAYPTQAPLQAPLIEAGSPTETGPGVGRRVRVATGAPVPGVENFEGTVKLVVTTTGTIKEMIGFVDAVRANHQIRILRMVSNPKRGGVDVWLRLRAPIPLRTTIQSMTGVSKVEPGDRTESEPDTSVLKVSLD